MKQYAREFSIIIPFLCVAVFIVYKVQINGLISIIPQTGETTVDYHSDKFRRVITVKDAVIINGVKKRTKKENGRNGSKVKFRRQTPKPEHPFIAKSIKKPNREAGLRSPPQIPKEAMTEAQGDSKKKPRFPSVIVIGNKKCGTAALSNFLDHHPDIVSHPGEPHFFDDHYERGLEWYRKQMPPSSVHQITLEKTPSYLRIIEVPERIYRYNSSIKLVLIVCNPVRRVVSDFLHDTAMGKIQPEVTRVEQAVLNKNGSIVADEPMIAMGLYYDLMLRWLKFFPMSSFHFVNGDAMRSNPIGELQSSEKFMGVKPFLSENNMYFDKARGFYCYRDKKRSQCLKKTKGRKHPEVEKSIIQKLKDFYRVPNTEFFKLINQTYEWD